MSVEERVNTRLVSAAFGRVLKELRTSRTLSQEKLAERAGIDATYVSLLERGLRAPGLPVVIAIGPALDVEPAALVTRTVEILCSEGTRR